MSVGTPPSPKMGGLGVGLQTLPSRLRARTARTPELKALRRRPRSRVRMAK